MKQRSKVMFALGPLRVTGKFCLSKLGTKDHVSFVPRGYWFQNLLDGLHKKLSRNIVRNRMVTVKVCVLWMSKLGRLVDR
jgi:hypothetical protein